MKWLGKRCLSSNYSAAPAGWRLSTWLDRSGDVSPCACVPLAAPSGCRRSLADFCHRKLKDMRKSAYPACAGKPGCRERASFGWPRALVRRARAGLPVMTPRPLACAGQRASTATAPARRDDAAQASIWRYSAKMEPVGRALRNRCAKCMFDLQVFFAPV